MSKAYTLIPYDKAMAMVMICSFCLQCKNQNYDQAKFIVIDMTLVSKITKIIMMAMILIAITIRIIMVIMMIKVTINNT